MPNMDPEEAKTFLWEKYMEELGDFKPVEEATLRGILEEDYGENITQMVLNPDGERLVRIIGLKCVKKCAKIAIQFIGNSEGRYTKVTPLVHYEAARFVRSAIEPGQGGPICA